MTLQAQDYIGDGVYVGHDGYHIWLAVGSHLNSPVVGLEPQVLDNLIKYAVRNLGYKVPKL